MIRELCHPISQPIRSCQTAWRFREGAAALRAARLRSTGVDTVPGLRGQPVFHVAARASQFRQFHGGRIGRTGLYGDRLRSDAPALLALDARAAAPDFSFSWQWNEHAYNDLTWELRLRQRVELFYRYTGLSRESARGLRLLDAGCGNGTLSAELAREGMHVAALDLSEGPVRAYRYQLFNSRVSQEAASRLNYVHGDLQRPPFPDGEFDLIYSDGVLHHNGEAIALTPENSQKVAAAVAEMRSALPKKPAEPNDPEPVPITLERIQEVAHRCAETLDELSKISHDKNLGSLRVFLQAEITRLKQQMLCVG